MTTTLATPPKRHSPAALAVFDELDSRVVDVFADIHAWRGWKFINNPKAPRPQSEAVVHEIRATTRWYQSHRAEAALALANHLRGDEAEIVKALSDELTNDPDAERHDYASLLGRPLAPACFAAAAIRARIAGMEQGLGLIGADYLFEQMGALIIQATEPAAPQAQPASETALVIEPTPNLEQRAQMMKQLILDVVTRLPDSAAAMLRGFDCFRVVYPLRVWDEAYERALKGGARFWPR